MSKAVMSDEDVIALVRKEFERKLKDFCASHGIEEPEEEQQEYSEEEPSNEPEKSQKTDKISIKNLQGSIGLRVSHRDSGLEYYLRGTNERNQTVELETPEGTSFSVDFNEFKQHYMLG